MNDPLSEVEARIIGCLIEKSVTTPDQYPLTLNSLTLACNQKSSREPVMNLSQGEVQHAVRELERKGLVMTEENFKSRTEKYSQRFCNSRYSDFQFDPAQRALVCLLLLRGPQTPGELRTRSNRLHSFAENSDVSRALETLANDFPQPLVVRLPRAAGRRDSEYMHLFCGPVDVDAYVHAAESSKPADAGRRVSTSDLELRVSALEEKVAELAAILEAYEAARQ